MADQKISGLAPVTDVQDGDEYPVARAGATKKITGANLKAAMPGGVEPTVTLTAGAGLAGGGDLSANRSFAVNVDGTTIEISSDTLRVKAGGITSSQIAADVATQAELDAHTADTTNAHAASAIGFTPTGTIAATTVQAAIAEVATEAGAAPALDLDDLTDVTAGSPADEDVLSWDAGATAWVPKPVPKTIEIKVFDDATVVTTGDGKVIFCVPAAFDNRTLLAAHAFVTTVSSSGTPTIQIRNVTAAADMLTTRITIDASEFTSYTAAAAHVVDAAHDDVATGDLLAIDVDAAGTAAKGLGVILSF